MLGFMVFLAPILYKKLVKNSHRLPIIYIGSFLFLNQIKKIFKIKSGRTFKILPLLHYKILFILKL